MQPREVPELHHEIRDLRRMMTDIEQMMADGFAEMRGKLDALVTGQQQIIARLNRGPGRAGGQ